VPGKKFVLLRFSALAALVLCWAGVVPAQAENNGDYAAANKPVTDKWAVVVGISKFANPSINLRYPAKDARDFYNYLISKGNFAPDHVRLLLDEEATRDRILDVLGDSWLPRVALPDDLVVIFISSHGSSSDSDICGVNYVVAHDTNPDKLFTTGIPMKALAETIKERVHSERVLVVLDTCHAGGASESKGLTRQANADAQALAQGTGQMVVCSSDKNQVSWEGKNMTNSVFTRNLIDAFQEKGETVPVAQVFDAVKEKVQEQVIRERGVVQTPVVETTRWSGRELVLGVPPTRPRRVPPEVAMLASAPVAVPAPQAAMRPAQTAVQPPLRASVQPPLNQLSVLPNNKSGSGASRSPRDAASASAQDFLRYHFKMVGERRFVDAWDDLGSKYRSRFKGDMQAYIASVSRHKWLSYTASDSEFSILPQQGAYIRVRVRMNSLTGFNGYWIYSLSKVGGLWAIEDVAVG